MEEAINIKNSVIKYKLDTCNEADGARESDSWGKAARVDLKEFGLAMGYLKKPTNIKARLKAQIKADYIKVVRKSNNRLDGQEILINPAYIFAGTKKEYDQALRDYNGNVKPSEVQLLKREKIRLKEALKLKEKQVDDLSKLVKELEARIKALEATPTKVDDDEIPFN